MGGTVAWRVGSRHRAAENGLPELREKFGPLLEIPGGFVVSCLKGWTHGSFQPAPDGVASGPGTGQLGQPYVPLEATGRETRVTAADRSLFAWR
jgi:hypothetical protein